MTFIIAEISSNHGGDLRKAQELIRAAEKCDCDAVKFQLYTPEDLGKQYDPKSNLIVPVEWLGPMFETAYKVGIPLFASIFHPTAVGVLHPFLPFAYKIASPESTRLTDATYWLISEAVHNEYAKLFISAGREQFNWAQSLQPDLMFYCKQGYPATLTEADLQIIYDMRSGFSDHTAGITESLAAIQAGAHHLEKHLKLDDDCIDKFAINPNQMARLCMWGRKWR